MSRQVWLAASACSKKMFSCGSQSRRALVSRRSATRCVAGRPFDLYQRVAPGVLSTAWLPGASSISMERWSPPAMPEGGCRIVAWQMAGPSGYRAFCTSNGPSCRLRASTVRPQPWAVKARVSWAFQGSKVFDMALYRQVPAHFVAADLCLVARRIDCTAREYHELIRKFACEVKVLFAEQNAHVTPFAQQSYRAGDVLDDRGLYAFGGFIKNDQSWL